MFIRNLLVFAALVFSFAGHASSDIDVVSLLSKGKQLYVFNSKHDGDAVVAIGLSAVDGPEDQVREIARTDAYKKMAAFIAGENMNSITEYKLTSDGSATSKSFFSKRTSTVSANVKAAREYAVGKFKGRTYVALLLSEKSISVSSELREKLSDNTLIATGYASLERGIEKARQMALDAALRNAVAMYNGVGAAGQSIVTDATNLRSSMATRANGVVSNYRITFEGKSDGSYKVEIVATIEEAATDPKQISEAVRENLGRPSIYIRTSDNYVSSALSELLVSNSFDVTTDRGSARYILEVDVEVDERPTLADMLGRRTALTLTLNDVLSSDPAIIISNDPSDSLEVSDNERIRASRSSKYAVESIQERLLSSLSGEFVDQFNNGSKVRLSFENFGKLRYVEKFVELLEGLPLTKKASLRPVEGSVAYVDLIYLGDPTELQLLVVKSANKYGLLGLRAKNKVDSSLGFKF